MSNRGGRAYVEGMATAPANWYPDPYEPARLRYWDGFRWTGYLVDPSRPDNVWFERPKWLPYVPGSVPAGINVPLSMSVTAAFM